MRNYECRVEPYSPAVHLDECLRLLESWNERHDSQDGAEPDVNAIKRAKELTATKLCLETADTLNLRGMVVYARDCAIARPVELKGFTFGEFLGPSQSSITIEKTDLSIKGLAQFIFSEFCRVEWSSRPLVNVGDDWGLETVRWTKQSYRPVKMLEKYVLRLKRAVMVAAA